MRQNAEVVERKGTKERNSNFELFRIILMLLIIAHHYTVNSGLTGLYDFNHITGNMLFLQLWGMFGKTIINCFTLITGYFMVRSNITLRKFLKLYLQVKFYYIVSFFIFAAIGYEPFTINGLITAVFSVIFEADKLYTGTYVMFFLFIPFLNLLAQGMTKRQYQRLLGLLIFFFTLISTFSKNNDTFHFIGWMMVTYLIGGYIRLHPCEVMDSLKWSLFGLVSSIALMAASVIVVDFVGARFGFFSYYHMFSDSHKLLALTCSVSAFLTFKNIKIPQNRLINQIAASTFGILLIHTNSATMRRFLWIDLLHNMAFYESKLLVVHAVSSMFAVYAVCLIIDQIRIAFIEKPLFHWLDQKKFFTKFDKKLEVKK